VTRKRESAGMTGMPQSYGTSQRVRKPLSTGDSVVHRSAIDPSIDVRARCTVPP
jgi:hypothetical protein